MQEQDKSQARRRGQRRGWRSVGPSEMLVPLRTAEPTAHSMVNDLQQGSAFTLQAPRCLHAGISQQMEGPHPSTRKLHEKQELHVQNKNKGIKYF